MDIGPAKGFTFADIRRVLDDPNSYTARWLVANGYGYIDETSATGTTKYWFDHTRDHSHYHIGGDTYYAQLYAKKMGVKYNPNVTPVFQMPGTTNTNEPLPPVNNGNNMNNGNDINHALYDNILAQNEALKQQNLDIASWNAQWKSLMDQENAAREATIAAQKKEKEDAQRAFGANLALGIVNNMGNKDNKSNNLMSTIVTPIINNAISNNWDSDLDNNMAAYGGRQYNKFDLGGPKTRYTPDGRKLVYAIVPKTQEIRWIDPNDTKDFNGVTGYRFYDDAGNKMHYTQWQDGANMQPSTGSIFDKPKLNDNVVFDKLQGIIDPETGNLLFPSDENYNKVRMGYNRGFYNPLSTGQLNNNQYNTLQPQWMVDQNADKYAERTSLGIGSLLNAGIIKPLELINPLNLLASCSSNSNSKVKKDNRELPTLTKN